MEDKLIQILSDLCESEIKAIECAPASAQAHFHRAVAELRALVPSWTPPPEYQEVIDSCLQEEVQA